MTLASYECSQHTVGKKELRRLQAFLCRSSQQQFITNKRLWSWQLSFHSGRAGRVWHAEARKTIEKRVLFVSWVDCLLLGILPGSKSFPALKRQGNKSRSYRTDLTEAPGQLHEIGQVQWLGHQGGRCVAWQVVAPNRGGRIGVVNMTQRRKGWCRCGLWSQGPAGRVGTYREIDALKLIFCGMKPQRKGSLGNICRG